MVIIRKVLIIAYAFPPWQTIGSLRSFGLAKYLPEWGWVSIILTSNYANRPLYPFTVIETPNHDKKESLKKYAQLEPLKKIFNYNSIQSKEKNVLNYQ